MCKPDQWRIADGIGKTCADGVIRRVHVRKCFSVVVFKFTSLYVGCTKPRVAWRSTPSSWRSAPKLSTWVYCALPSLTNMLAICLRLRSGGVEPLQLRMQACYFTHN